jgi:transposase
MIRARWRRRLSKNIQLELLKYFCAAITARLVAELTGVDRNTVILFFQKLPEVIFEQLASS